MSKIPFIRRILSDAQYDWMLKNLPFRLMYSNRYIDSQHQMWFPRWGYSKRQIADAKKRAEEMKKSLKFD